MTSRLPASAIAPVIRSRSRKRMYPVNHGAPAMGRSAVSLWAVTAALDDLVGKDLAAGIAW